MSATENQENPPANLKTSTAEATTMRTVTKAKQPAQEGAGDPGHHNQKQDQDQDPH